MGGEYGDKRDFDCKNMKDGLKTNLATEFATRVGQYIGTELTVVGGGPTGWEMHHKDARDPIAACYKENTLTVLDTRFGNTLERVLLTIGASPVKAKHTRDRRKTEKARVGEVMKTPTKKPLSEAMAHRLVVNMNPAVLVDPEQPLSKNERNESGKAIVLTV